MPSTSKWCIGQSVERGVISNVTHNRVRGLLEIAGRDQPVQLDLVGNCSSDLQRREFEFEATGPVLPVPDDINIDGVGCLQIGVAGTITLRHEMASHEHRSDLHTIARSAFREPPGGSLVIEWFGPYGQVVVEVHAPQIDELEISKERWPAIAPPDSDQLPPSLYTESYLRGVHLRILGLENETGGEIPQQVIGLDPAALDPYGLHSPSPYVTLGDDGRYVSMRVYPRPSIWELARQAPPDTPIFDLISPTISIPPEEFLEDDGMVAAAYMAAVAHLAQHSISVQMCPHMTPRSAYRILCEQICASGTVGGDPHQFGEGAVLVMPTWNDCKECEREALADFE